MYALVNHDWHHGNMNLFADAGTGPGKSFLLLFRQLETPEYYHSAKGSLVQTKNDERLFL